MKRRSKTKIFNDIFSLIKELMYQGYKVEEIIDDISNSDEYMTLYTCDDILEELKEDGVMPGDNVELEHINNILYDLGLKELSDIETDEEEHEYYNRLKLLKDLLKNSWNSDII